MNNADFKNPCGIGAVVEKDFADKFKGKCKPYSSEMAFIEFMHMVVNGELDIRARLDERTGKKRG